MVFDLDPGDGAGLTECAQVALWIRELHAKRGLESYVKTSGQKGLHVCVPLNHSSATFQQTKDWSRRVAEVLELQHPALITSRMTKKLRAGKVLIDWSQNTDFKSTVSVYSLRAADHPTVSLPIAWQEIDSVQRLAALSPAEVVQRVRRRGDLFEAVRLKVQKLPSLATLDLPRLRLKSA